MMVVIRDSSFSVQQELVMSVWELRFVDSVVGQPWFGSVRGKSGQHQVTSSQSWSKVRLTGFGQRFRSSGLVRLSFGMVDSVKPSQHGQPGQLIESTRSTQLTRSTQSTFLAFQH
ncbi:hypothetical protein Hanom_Chr11g01012641 [Helianthus anomalus]